MRFGCESGVRYSHEWNDRASQEDGFQFHLQASPSQGGLFLRQLFKNSSPRTCCGPRAEADQEENGLTWRNYVTAPHASSPRSVVTVWCHLNSESDLPLDQRLFQFRDLLCGIEALRAGFRAVQDGVAAVDPERILQIVKTLAGPLITAVLHPAVRLQQRGGAEIAVRIPPVARTGRRAARAEDAFVD